MVDCAAKTNSVTTSTGIKLAAFFSISLRRAPSNDYMAKYLVQVICDAHALLPLKMDSGNTRPAGDPDDAGCQAHHRDHPWRLRRKAVAIGGLIRVLNA